MINNDEQSKLNINPDNIIIPHGWTVISHGTSFHKWNEPMPGYPSQNLDELNSIIVHDTINGGLVCCFDDNSNLPFIYAGSDNPVVFRVFVPQYGPSFDVQTIEDGLRFLKPQGLNNNEALVPANTTLIKVCTQTDVNDNGASVIWYVPEQYAEQLYQELYKIQLKQERAAKDVDEASVLVLDENISSNEENEEEHLLEQEEKADEYYEDLEEQQQIIIDAEIDAELQKAEKRAKDTAKARQQDKIIFANIEKEHQERIAAENEARYNREQADFYTEQEQAYQDDYSPNEPYAYSDGFENDSNPFEDVPQNEEVYNNEQTYTSTEQDQPYQDDYSSDEPYKHSDSFENDSKSFEEVAKNQEDYNNYSETDSQPGIVHDSVAPEYVEYDNSTKYDAPVNYNDSEQLHSGLNNSSEDLNNFPNNKSEPFETKTPVDSNVQPVPVSLDSDVVNIDNNEKTFSKAYSEDIRKEQQLKIETEEAELQQKEAEKQRRQQVQDEAYRRQQKVDNYESFGSSGIDFSGNDNHTVSSKPSEKDIKPPYSDTAPDLKNVSGFDSKTTVQNPTSGGDVLNRHEATKLKDPPNTPVDNSPLKFDKERFRAIRRWANHVCDSDYRVLNVVKNEVVQLASSSGDASSQTARQITSVSRGIQGFVYGLDVMTGASTNKSDAKNVLRKHFADSANLNVRDVSKKDIIKEYGTINTKNVEKHLKENLTVKDVKNLHKKYGIDADIGVAAATGTKNGQVSVKVGGKEKKINVFVDGKVDVRISQGKIGALRERSTNLKSQIKELTEKGSALTQTERQRLSDLINTKKANDEKLRNLVGATNERKRLETLYAPINRMSPKKLDQEIKKLEAKIKAGKKLNKVQKKQLEKMKERQALLKANEKMPGKRDRFGRTKLLLGSSGRQLNKLMRQSEDSTMVLMPSLIQNAGRATRFATSRYVRGALKYSIKAVLKPVKAAARLTHWIGKKTGVNKVISKSANAAKSRLLHTKPGEKIHSLHTNTTKLRTKIKNNGGLKKSVAKGLKTSIKKITPNKAKLAAKNVREVFARLNKNPVVRGVKGILSAPFKGIKFLSKGINFIKKLGIKYIAMPIAVTLAILFLVYTIMSVLMGIPGSTFTSENESDDGRIDLTNYIEILNKEQKKISDRITNYKKLENGDKYTRVIVEYSGNTNGNNYKEILSMTAVYFQQDFSNGTAVKDYIVSLFNASNYTTTRDGNQYFCSGCIEREYKCYEKGDEYNTAERDQLYEDSDHSDETYVSSKADKGCKKSSTYSCMTQGHGTYNKNGCQPLTYHNGGSVSLEPPENCYNYSTIYSKGNKPSYQCNGHGSCHGRHYDYSCPGHKEKICKGHIDLYVSVTCLDLDKLYTIDPNVNIYVETSDYQQGDLIGKFDLTYYCAEKYPHICNAGPPYKTASGTDVVANRTIAVDPSIIPLGTPVFINGKCYVAEDTGGAIKKKKIDIAVKTHEEALSLGKERSVNVYKAIKNSSGDGSDAKPSPRRYISYLELAQDFDGGEVSGLKIFGKTKGIEWSYVRGFVDTVESFEQKLQVYDTEHKDKSFSNAELNAFEYIKMSNLELLDLCKKRDIKVKDSYNNWVLITNYLLPYDHEHPDEYVVDQNSQESTEQYYFEGWNDENQEWCKTIFDNMTSEIYAGLDKISDRPEYSFVSLEGIKIYGSKIPITYYCQKDYTHVHLGGYSDKTIASSGCGFTSMAIVVSSLTDKEVDPAVIAKNYGNYYVYNVGASSALYEAVCKDYGLTCKNIGKTNIQGVIDALKDGKLVVAGLGEGGAWRTGTGYYRGVGHIVVICGITEDGKFLLADPNQREISVTGEPIEMQHFLNSGINSLRVISK